MHSMQSVEKLNRLLRAELSAIETYEQALHRTKEQNAIFDLRLIAEDHRLAAQTLRQHVRLFGGVPERSSDASGIWAKNIESSEVAAIKALKDGEENGLKEYQEALDTEDLELKCRTLISTDLMSRQRRHINTLNQRLTSLN